MNELFYNVLNDIDKEAEIIVQLLSENSLTLSTAESCTGGLLSAAITGIPGASEVFGLGLCVYANSNKEKYLGVKNETLTLFGAVSKETALEMAWGVKNAGKADFGLSTTGIAGPGGGTPEKPVGLVYIAAASGRGEKSILINAGAKDLPKEQQRKYIRYLAVLEGLKLMNRMITDYIQKE